MAKDVRPAGRAYAVENKVYGVRPKSRDKSCNRQDLHGRSARPMTVGGVEREFEAFRRGAGKQREKSGICFGGEIAEVPPNSYGVRTLSGASSRPIAMLCRSNAGGVLQR